MREPLPRLDTHPEIRKALEKHCRLSPGEYWDDPVSGHRVGVIDAADAQSIASALKGFRPKLFVHDPPYNVSVGGKDGHTLRKTDTDEYIAFCRQWMNSSVQHSADDAAFYVWLGADQKDGFRPLPEFMVMMREFEELRSRSFITMRNQRGYGTQQNWMAVRQELLYYAKGNPPFSVSYTDIPKILRGYYKDIGGVRTENSERGKSSTIRASNVWVDVQQVFYLMEENVPGCYAQKPLRSIARIIDSSSMRGDTVADFFAHAGTTLIACEMAGRRCITFDIDPVFAEMTIRRLEHFRESGETGFQAKHPFREYWEGITPNMKGIFN